jgi:hypothetical protein
MLIVHHACTWKLNNVRTDGAANTCVCTKTTSREMYLAKHFSGIKPAGITFVTMGWQSAQLTEVPSRATAQPDGAAQVDHAIDDATAVFQITDDAQIF